MKSNLIVIQAPEKSLKLEQVLLKLEKQGQAAVFSPQVENLLNNQVESIQELVIVRLQGGLTDNQGNLVSFLSPHNLDKLKTGEHPRIESSPEIEKLAEKISHLLKSISKIVVTTLDDIMDELENPLGAGTLCMNIEGGDFTSAIKTPHLAKSFEEVYQSNTQNGTWLDRGEEGKDKVLQSHLFYEVDKTLLGGFSHKRLNDTLIMIQCVWSQSKWGGNGISQTMLNQYIKHQPGTALALFCNSKNEAALNNFQKMGFIQLPSSHPQYKTIIDVPHGESSIPMILGADVKSIEN